MFKTYSNIINLDEVIKTEYNYTFNGNQKDFYNQNFIELEGDGKDALCWIKWKDEKYLFKPIEDFNYNVWGELLSQEIAKLLNIPCAEYRVGKLHGQLGLISKSFLQKDDTLLLGSTIFQDFFNKNFISQNNHPISSNPIIDSYQIPTEYLKMNPHNQKKYIFNYLNNLEQVQTILKNNPDLNQSATTIITQFLLKMLLFDLITLQGDRHPNNWGIIKNKTTIKPSPLYDNSTSFGLGYPLIEKRITMFQSELAYSKILKDKSRLYSMIYQTRPNFTLSNKNIIDKETRKKDIIPKVLTDLLQKSPPQDILLIKETITKINPDKLENIIETLEQTNGIKMPANLYYYIINIFELNINNLKEIIKNYREEKENEEPRKNNRKI